MKYRKISGTHLKLSEVGLDVSFDPKLEPSRNQELVHLLRYAVDRGINFFSCSSAADNGFGERLLGEALADERERIILAAKFGGKPVEEGFSAKTIKKSCEESLSRLRTDHVDLYQMHHPGLSEIQQDDIYATLGRLKKEGKILYSGAVLDSDPDNLEVGELLMRFRKLSALQVTYNILEQDPAYELTAIAKKRDVSVIASVTESSQLEWKTDYGKKMKELDFLVRDREMSLAQATLKFVLKEPSVAAALVAVRTEAELNECAVLSECPELSEEEIRMVRHLYKNNFYLPAAISQLSP